MADKGMQKGDEVSWNYGNGQPSGTIEEIKTDGKLEIESKGKKVHKNADPSNPAVHVAREGNDVVKRASELTKIGEAEQGKEGNLNKRAGKAEGGKSKTKGGKLAEVGEKREREEEAVSSAASTNEGDATVAPGEHVSVERDAGKETKKPKVDAKDDAGTDPSAAIKAPPAKKGRGGKQTPKTTAKPKTAAKSKTAAEPAKKRTSARNAKKGAAAEEGTAEVQAEGGSEVVVGGKELAVEGEVGEGSPAVNTRSQDQ